MKAKRVHLGVSANGLPPSAMQAVLDALDCQIAVLAASGDVVVVNEAWRRMAESDVPCATRVPPGRNYLRAASERDVMSREAQEAAAGVRAVLARRMSRFSVEYPCDTDGGKQWFLMHATACEISGSPHAVVVHRSIETNDQRTIENELRAALARKEEFLVTLLHELRNPLAPMANALEILGRYGHDANFVARARDIIQRQLRQITRLVDDLFDISRSKRELMHTQRAVVDLAEVVTIAVESAQPLVELRRHTLTASVVPDRFKVHADMTRLVQVMTNLLINAAKYTPPGGHISVICEETATDVLMHVRDSGVGLAPEQLSRVFEWFAQAASPREARMGGLGIGLALAQELMRLQGGSISARSEGLGRGSEFTVSLPRVDAVPA
jgi:signal transduction histidine kinase